MSTSGAGTILRGAIVSHGAITLGDSTLLTGAALSTGTITMANTQISAP